MRLFPPGHIRSSLALVLTVGVIVSAFSTPCSAHVATGKTTVQPVLGCAQLKSSTGARSSHRAVQVISASVTKIKNRSFCDLEGVISSTLGFSLRMPTSTWTGSYLQEGCGGYCGVVAPSVPLLSRGCPAVEGNELALATDDEGHTSTSATDGRWAANNQGARALWGYGSEHALAVTSKALIKRYYGRGPRFSYFDGCSDGGREALIEAQRYPHDFNGILAGAPAILESELNGEFQDWLILANTDASGHEILTSENLPALHRAVEKACEGTDGYIVDPRGCAFNPESIACAPGTSTDRCLTPAQVDVVKGLYRGPTDTEGQSLYPGGEPYGSELAWASWFIDPADDSAWPSDTVAYQFASSFQRYLAYPFDPPATFTLSQFRFNLSDYKKVTALDATYDALNPNLRAFSGAGGKLIVYQGWSDEAVPPFGTVDYYAAVVNQSGGFSASQQFSRLYMIPGQYHCLMGGNPQVIGDLLDPLMKWVEHGVAPATLSFSRVHPTTKLKVISVSPLNPLAQMSGRPRGLNATYSWVGSFPTSAAAD